MVDAINLKFIFLKSVGSSPSVSNKTKQVFIFFFFLQELIFFKKKIYFSFIFF